MESKITTNLPEKTSDKKIYQRKRSIKRRITKKLRWKSQYFLSVLILILLYKRWNFRKL